MLKRIANQLFLSIFLFLLSSPSLLYAAPYVDPVRDKPPELNGAMIEKFLDDVVYRYIFPIAGLISFGFIVKGGYMWMMSSGDPDKVKEAQGTLTWSVIGLVFVILARLLMGVILDIIA